MAISNGADLTFYQLSGRVNMNYFVINLDSGEFWEGEAENAREAYQHITIKKGDTTSIRYGRLSNVKIWNKDNKGV